MSLFDRKRKPDEPNVYAVPCAVAWKRVPDPHSVQ